MNKISDKERQSILLLKSQGYSIRMIAKIVWRSRVTVTKVIRESKNERN